MRPVEETADGIRADQFILVAREALVAAFVANVVHEPATKSCCRVCVKLFDALLMVTVILCPRFTEVGLILTEDVRGIVESAMEPLALPVPILTPFQFIPKVSEKSKLMDLDPSALCEIVVVPLAMDFVPLPPITVVLFATVVPLMVIL